MDTPKRKVAVLGSGVGSIVTAFELTQPAVRDRFEVTIYQMGWRVGGKGASGRNAAFGQRIEEHGPHVWSGLYDNSFRVMRAIYEELGRPPAAPLATWRDAFKPYQGTMSMMEEFDGKWTKWSMQPPENDLLPGEPDAHLMLPIWAYVSQALQLVRRWFRDSQRAKHVYHRASSSITGRSVSTVTNVVVVGLIEVAGALLAAAFQVAAWAHRALEWVLKRLGLGAVIKMIHAAANAVVGVLIGVVRLFVRLHWRRVRPHIHDPEVRKHWIFLNFATGIMRGLHKDRVIARGFNALDDVDFRSWLAVHLVPDLAVGPRCVGSDPPEGPRSVTLNSPLAMFLYDANFCYEGGDPGKPALSAGVALQSLVRLALTCKGALIWQMQAGMGDVVFGPAYEVLKRRGVRFEFFRQVRNLELSEDGRRIAAIELLRQAELADGRTSYDPLIDVKGLPCWPSEPLWDQLRDGRRLRDEGVDFEDWYGPEGVSMKLLEGRDFDTVVLGISLGGLPYVCGSLIEASEEWRAMVENVGTVATQSLQLWLDVTSEEAGQDPEGYPTVSCYDTTNFTSWMDASFLLGREAWPPGTGGPKSIQYVAGVMRDSDPRGRRQTRTRLDRSAAATRVRSEALDYLKNQVFRITPRIATDGTFEWPRLVAPTGTAGPSRLDAQYCRGNVDPSGRYVLSLPGTTRFRLHPGDSKFDNLVIAGDWTWSCMNSGCVEGAAVSAMLAAHAISESPPLDTIVGLTFGDPESRYRRAG